MIQRIQTVYLFLVGVLSVVVFFSPIAAIVTQANVFELSYRGFTATPPIDALHSSTWALLLVGALIPFVAFVSIFLFKKRKLQVTMCYINFLLIDAYYIIVVASLWFADQQLALPSRWSYHYAIILPVVNMVLTFMAIRSINKDEALVRSLDRLR